MTTSANTTVKPTSKKKTPKKPVTPKVKKPRNYLNNADMMKQIEASLAQEKMTDEFVKMMMMLTDRYGNHPKYSNYTYNADMKSYALLMICHTWHKFKPERSDNPFAFFTQCIKHSFYQYLNKEKKQRNIRDEMLINVGMNPSNTYLTEYEQKQKESDDLQGTIVDIDVSDHIGEMVGDNI